MINVTAGQSLQTAIDQAQPGETINVEAGVTFRGPVILTPKSGTLTIQSSRTSELPQGRVLPIHSGLMPKIVASNAEQALRTKPGASFYRIDGVEFLPESASIILYDLVRFGDSRQAQKRPEDVPHHLIFERCYVHGLPQSSFQRGLLLNSSDSKVSRCYFSEIHGRGMDSQAIASWNTPGMLEIEDCYLEAAGENFMLGGSDPASEAMIPADVKLLRCYLFKPLVWKTTNAPWVVKNLLELKLGKRVKIDGNVLENNWGGQREDKTYWGQDGKAVLFTVRNQDGSAPWSVIEDVIYSNNTLKNADGALNLLGTDNEKPSARCRRLLIENNVFDQIRGTFLQINGYHDVTVRRNTHLQSGNTMVFYKEVSENFVYENNLTIEKPYGIRDEDGAVEGTKALERWTKTYVFLNNVIASPQTKNPLGNDYPASLTIGPDYLTAYSGRGVDIDRLLAAQKGQLMPTSSDGTKGITITDGKGRVWTFGSQGVVLRDGTSVGGAGTIFKFFENIVYVLGMDKNWYAWHDKWVMHGIIEPGLKPEPSEIYVSRTWPTAVSEQLALLNTMRGQGFRWLAYVGNGTTFFEKV